MEFRRENPEKEYEHILVRAFYNFYKKMLGLENYRIIPIKPNYTFNRKKHNILDKLDYNLQLASKQAESVYNPKANQQFVGLYDKKELVAFSRVYTEEKILSVPEILICKDDLNKKTIYLGMVNYLEDLATSLNEEGIFIEVPFNNEELISLLLETGYDVDKALNNFEDIQEVTKIFSKPLRKLESGYGRNLNCKQTSKFNK